MPKGKTDDPAWSRGGNTANKKRKMCSRASMRLLTTLIRKKKLVDKGKAKTVCVTRTVELPSTHNVGDESSKLLFALAIGLLPNCKEVKQGGSNRNAPIVMLERLDPVVEAEATARTRDVIYEIFHRRKIQSLQNRIFQSIPSPKNVEVVDLVSSEDESASDNETEPVIVQETFRSRFHSSSRNDEEQDTLPTMLNSSEQATTKNAYRRNMHKSSQKYPFLFNSSVLQNISQSRNPPVFKQITPNEDCQIFKNWKPDSMSRLIQPKISNSTSTNKSSQSFHNDKFLSSLKSIPTTATLTLRNVPQSLPYKNSVHGILEDTSTPDLSDLLVADTLITID